MSAGTAAERLKVALVHESFALSKSLERQRVLLARALVHAGAEVHFYGNIDDRTTEVPGVVLHPVLPRVRQTSRLAEAWTYARFAAATTKAVRRDRNRYDVIDVSGTTAWEHDVICVHAVAAAEQRRWPQRGGRSYRTARLRSRVMHIRNPRFAVVRTIERLQYRRGRFALALAVTEGVRRDLMTVHGVPQDRIEVEPYPIDIDQLQGADGGQLRRTLGIGNEVPLALFVGHGFERKGLADAVRTVASLDGIHLAVVGADDAEPYAKLARDLGARDRVHFVGSTEQPEATFRDADVFLLPTYEDVWGITVVEAMAAGVPVVTTDAAGSASLVKETGAGLVVPAASIRSLREAVGLVLADAQGRREMGARGEAAAARYGLDSFGARMLDHYERAMRTARRPAAALRL